MKQIDDITKVPVEELIIPDTTFRFGCDGMFDQDNGTFNDIDLIDYWDEERDG